MHIGDWPRLSSLILTSVFFVLAIHGDTFAEREFFNERGCDILCVWFDALM